MAIRKIRKYDDEILRKRCKEVKVIDYKIKQLINDMIETMYHTDNGAAIAANQVGILKRIIVIDLGEGDIIKLINPEILEQEGEQIVEEGCLSFPDVWGKVKRPYKIKVKALNEDGEEFELGGKGLLAQCLSHEIEHLDGIVFIDKIIERITP